MNPDLNMSDELFRNAGGCNFADLKAYWRVRKRFQPRAVNESLTVVPLAALNSKLYSAAESNNCVERRTVAGWFSHNVLLGTIGFNFQTHC